MVDISSFCFSQFFFFVFLLELLMKNMCTIFRVFKKCHITSLVLTVNKGLNYPYSMLLNLNQYRGRVRVINNCNFIMIRDDSRSLGRLSLNFLAIFICFFSAKRFVTLLLFKKIFVFFLTNTPMILQSLSEDLYFTTVAFF